MLLLPEQSSPRQGKANMEKGVFIKPRQPFSGSLLLHGGKRGLQSWGLDNRSRSLGVLLWVQRDRQGWRQAGLCREGAAGTRGWICPRQGFLLLPQAALDTSREAALEWGHGALWALQRPLWAGLTPGDITLTLPS